MLIRKQCLKFEPFVDPENRVYEKLNFSYFFGKYRKLIFFKFDLQPHAIYTQNFKIHVYVFHRSLQITLTISHSASQSATQLAHLTSQSLRCAEE